MKIDIHTHTKKCKSGDPYTREIAPADFCDIILSTDVRIIAITNHNTFDLAQFLEIRSHMGDDAQVWPGAELDVVENDSRRGHLLVVVSPTKAIEFSDALKRITEGSTPDDFTISIGDVLKTFDQLSPLYVAHYKQKKPDLSNEAIDELMLGTKSPFCVIKEVSNSISAGIYISHGHASIYGSDVQDWSTYKDTASNLPDLRLAVGSFEHFCLLLAKDTTTINTALDKKTSQTLLLNPFGDAATLELKIYDDINIIFGSKGTGKSCILKAIARHYTENGIEALVYESASDRLDKIFDTKGKDLTINLNNNGINYCTNEIGNLRNAKEVDVTSIARYSAFFRARSTNRNAIRLLLKNIEPEEESGARRDFLELNEAEKKTGEFLDYLTKSPSINRELTPDEHWEVVDVLTKLRSRLSERKWQYYSGWKEIALMNSAISTVRREVARKTGIPAKPTTTGFHHYALNRINIEIHAIAVLSCVESRLPTIKQTVGSLGANKGTLEFCTEFAFHNGVVSDGSWACLSDAKKGVQKQFVNAVRKIRNQAYTDNLFQHVSELNEIDDVETIKTVYELLLFKRYFALNGLPYTPSSGEASMVMLHKELETERDVYILDEPEKSLGNEYISDVIVPLLKQRARDGKRIFISTHDANIAVRTLPYRSIYRCHGQDGYSTYVGNPFSNNLVNVSNTTDFRDWKKISMRTLEGGEEAFGERGKIYGND